MIHSHSSFKRLLIVFVLSATISLAVVSIAFADRPIAWATCVRCARVTAVVQDCRATRKPNEVNKFLGDVSQRLDQFAQDITVTAADQKKMLTWTMFECGHLDDFNTLLSPAAAEQVLKQFPTTPTTQEINTFVESLPESIRSRRADIERAITLLRRKARTVINDENVIEN